MSAKCKFQSSDGKIFNVDKKVAFMSTKIRNMIKTAGDKKDENIPTLMVRSSILTRIINWAYQHVNDPPVRQYQWEKSEISPANKKFFERSDAVDDILPAAHYLDMKGLFYAACLAYAEKYPEQTLDKIRQTYCKPKKPNNQSKKANK